MIAKPLLMPWSVQEGLDHSSKDQTRRVHHRAGLETQTHIQRDGESFRSVIVITTFSF